jgi:hypothetical protein
MRGAGLWACGVTKWRHAPQSSGLLSRGRRQWLVAVAEVWAFEGGSLPIIG